MQSYLKCVCVIVLGFNILHLCLSLPPHQEAENHQGVPPSGEPQLGIQVLAHASDCPRKSKEADILVIHYEGFFDNGTKFDSSRERPGAIPFQFQLGVGQVIQGWEKGLLDMCAGEKRQLSVPSRLAYGEHGSAPIIAPNSDLVFEVELIQIHDGPKPPNVFKLIDIDNDNHLTKDEMSMYLARQAHAQGIPVDLAAKQQEKVLDNLFKFEDKNGDGRISHEEFSGPKHEEL
ncbi:peptidyl-prolyl cis-trans isomerase FKBP2-like [Saccostrea echinata]|uniref:peptidyl-prolyl cis-trans isomerase FKBP2-like n=1 Tax=Saccostrea echinata TaxID=191078 RepID=UPI002A7F0385|nr:peptidyl-prolyl cis-trans isomerase FKBP2-like [Saccostrea echinata]